MTRGPEHWGRRHEHDPIAPAGTDEGPPPLQHRRGRTPASSGQCPRARPAPGEPVSTTMHVTRDDAGSYALEQTTIEIQMQVVGGDNLRTMVNGVEVDNRLLLKVVPGTYTPSTGLPFLSFPEKSSLITISSLSYSDIAVYLINPELTAEGQTALMDAARAALERCIASKELAPTGCPNARKAPRAEVKGSVASATMLGRDPDSVAVTWER